jgi:WD40 repeat protein
MPSTAGYDAFISYSRRQDGWLAPALQGGLERFAKPWYRVRELRVFRDKASLAASPELWGSIEAALRNSRWLILLSSKEAAESPWVDREVAWWLANKSADHILVVATSDRLRWDKKAGDWAEGAPVPPSLRGAFRTEPLWADLTGVRAGRRGVRVPDEDLASMAAPLRGVDRDTLIGEHLRQHRRTMRVVRSVIATLTALLVFAVAATVIAVGQRDDARTQARIATARELAALSGSMVGSNLDVARLLAVGAYQLDRDPQTEAAVWQAAAASPQLVRFLQAGSSPVNALASSADGTTIVAGTENGDLVAFDLATGRRTTVHAMSGAIAQLSVSADGHTVAAMDTSQAVTWIPGAPRAVPISGVRQPTDVAVSPSGAQTVVLEGYGVLTAESLIVRSADGDERSLAIHQQHAGATEEYDSLAFPSSSSLVLMSGNGQWQRLDAATLQMTAALWTAQITNHVQAAGTAQDNAYAGFDLEGRITAWSTSGAGQPGTFLYGTVPGGPASVLTVQPDGQEAAVARSSTIDVVQLYTSPTASSQGVAPVQLTGSSDTTGITFLGNGGELASVAGSTISVWNPEQTSRLSAPTGIAVPLNSESEPPPVLLASPDGAWTDLVGGGETGAWLIASGQAGSTAAKHVPGSAVVNGGWDLPVRNGDTPLLIGLDSGGLVLGDADGTIVRTLPAPPLDQAPGESAGDAVPPVPAGAGMLPGGKQFVLVGTDGSVQVYDIPAGTYRQVVRADIASNGNMDYVYPLNVAISPDGTAVAFAEWLAQGSGGFTSLGVRYVDLRTGRSHMVGTGAADGVLFTSGNLLVQRDDGNVEVWSFTGQTKLRTLAGTGAVTPAMAVSPDGTLLARLRDDGTLSITDLASGDVLGTFSLPYPGTPPVDPWLSSDIAFASDGSLLTATTGGQLIRWTVDPPDLVRGICATVGGTLTDAQWQQYAGTSPPAVMPCAS